MRIIIVLIMVLCLWVCTIPFSHTEEAAKTAGETVQTSTPVLQTKTTIPLTEEPDLVETLESIHNMTKSAQVAAKTIGRTLGQYVREKYNQQKQIEILSRFNSALASQLASLPLAPAERSALISKIEEAYIRDSESGANQLDQNYFHDLSYVIKKEHSELLLGKAQEGTVQTYDYDGNLKTKWTFRNGKPEGPAITYYSSGEIKFIDLYENGERISRKKYDEEGKLIFEQDYTYEKKQEQVAAKIEEPKKSEAPAASLPSAPAVSELKQPETPAPAAKQPEAPAVAKEPAAPAPAASEKKPAPAEADSFIVPVTYSKSGSPEPVKQPLSSGLDHAAGLNPTDGQIEVIFKETRTQTVQNETQHAGSAVGGQTKALIGS